MNTFALLRSLLVLLYFAKEILYYAWIFPSWWVAHSRAYDTVLRACAQNAAGAPPAPVRCEVLPRMLHPMGAVRTLLVYEAILKGSLVFLVQAIGAHWQRAFAYHNRLRGLELLLGGWILVAAFAWRHILRAHEEVRASVPGMQLSAPAGYFQKWIAPWLDLVYLLFLWVVFAVDLFPA